MNCVCINSTAMSPTAHRAVSSCRCCCHQHSVFTSTSLLDAPQLRRQCRALQRMLEAALQRSIVLVPTDNTRHMLTVGSCRVDRVQHIRLHHMLISAPVAVRRDVIAHIAHGDKAARRRVGAYIRANKFRTRPLACYQPRTVRNSGSVHNLGTELTHVRDHMFDGDIGHVSITWARRTAGPRHHSILLASYSPDERLIRVNPVLDAVWVPVGFVRMMIAHELLHHILGCSGHPEIFTTREQQLPGAAYWLAWENKNIDALLAA